MALKIVCLSIVLIVFFFVIFDIMIDYCKEKRAKKKIKKIGDFTLKEFALLCKKHLKNHCKDCPFSTTNKTNNIKSCIWEYWYPAGIPFNNTIERKDK
jgi:hypothetical protein